MRGGGNKISLSQAVFMAMSAKALGPDWHPRTIVPLQRPLAICGEGNREGERAGPWRLVGWTASE